MDETCGVSAEALTAKPIDAELEAGARAVRAIAGWPDDEWDRLPLDAREGYYKIARAVLTAARVAPAVSDDAEGKWPVDEMGIPECQRLVYPQNDRIGYPCSKPALVEVRDTSGEWVPWCDRHADEVSDRSRVREPRDVDMEIIAEDWIIDRPRITVVCHAGEHEPCLGIAQDEDHVGFVDCSCHCHAARL